MVFSAAVKGILRRLLPQLLPERRGLLLLLLLSPSQPRVQPQRQRRLRPRKRAQSRKRWPTTCWRNSWSGWRGRACQGRPRLRSRPSGPKPAAAAEMTPVGVLRLLQAQRREMVIGAAPAATAAVNRSTVTRYGGSSPRGFQPQPTQDYFMFPIFHQIECMR